ncbi:hypothetical protein Q1695_000937 [Nippostrongylus brasiliensis]|nr:hypothetical protein Q1695_000937 [Nippostrongylus brasiliensis]
MSQAMFILATVFFLTFALVEQTMFVHRSFPPRLTSGLDERHDLTLAEKRDFRFHASRGKKHDEGMPKRYSYTPSRGKKSRKLLH